MEERKNHMPVGQELVRMSGITKEFTGVKALEDVRFNLYSA